MTTETTFGNSNPELWKSVTPECVFEGIRNVVANRLATTGREWCDYFSMHNSGTYVTTNLHSLHVLAFLPKLFVCAREKALVLYVHVHVYT